MEINARIERVIGKAVLDVKMPENDANAETIREYFLKLLSKVWKEEEGFDGKRPFGNSGWTSEVYNALYLSGMIAEDDEGSGDGLIAFAIKSLGE